MPTPLSATYADLLHSPRPSDTSKLAQSTQASSPHFGQGYTYSQSVEPLSGNTASGTSLEQPTTSLDRLQEGSINHSKETQKAEPEQLTLDAEDDIPVRQESEGDEEQVSGAWRCPYPGCSSRVLFTRACDLKKHFGRHLKQYYCRIEGCPRSQSAATSSDGNLGAAFSTKKDRLRHETKHDPNIKCEHCGKLFSREDNMWDHIRRLHGQSSLGKRKRDEAFLEDSSSD
jgi:DNA-directed RNA polymerase subunit RPC12/RpoP